MNGDVANGGLRGVWPPFLESAFFGDFFARFLTIFALFRRVCKAPGKSRKRKEKGLFPQMSLALAKPPSLKLPSCGTPTHLRWVAPKGQRNRHSEKRLSKHVTSVSNMCQLVQILIFFSLLFWIGLLFAFARNALLFLSVFLFSTRLRGSEERKKSSLSGGFLPFNEKAGRRRSGKARRKVSHGYRACPRGRGTFTQKNDIRVPPGMTVR